MAKLTLSFKGRIIDVFHLEDKCSTIGRDSACTIVIDSLAIAPVHLQIIQETDACYLIAVDADRPLSVNHNPVTEAALAHGDVIEIGKHTLSFSDDAVDFGASRPLPLAEPEKAGDQAAEPADGPDSDRSGCIQILDGEHLGRIIPLNRSMVRLGRSGRECAVIAHRNSGYFLSHLEGPEPPSVNGQPIGNRSFQLVHGSVIQIGDTRMQFYADLR